VLAIAISAISPTTSVFLVYGSGLSSAGTGIVWAFVIAAVIAVSMALCYAEVGSVFPSAGGAYTIVQKALGSVWGGATSVLFMLLGLVSTASILVASATYLSSLVPGGLPVGWVALGMVALVTALSVGKIAPASWVAGAMLLLELTVVLVFTGVAFAHTSGDNHPFTDPAIAGHGGAPASVGAAGVLAAVVPALFAFNGYDWPLYFTEETTASRRARPPAVGVAGGVAVVVEVLAVIAATFAIRDLDKTTADASPLSLIAHQVMGPTGATILLIGVVVAMFDTGLAANLGYARVYYAAARDGMMPGPLSRFFGHLSRQSKVPTYAFAFLFVGNGVLCVFSSLNDLITFTGVMIVTIYLLVAVSALVCRVRDRDLSRPFRMPLWPLPPVVAIVGAVIALTQQEARDLAIAFGITVIALVGYFASRSRLPERLADTRRGAPDPDLAQE
jgi:amino acid transporter